MTDSLLVSLSSYRPTKERRPIEDFITEAFAWLLRNHSAVGSDFLDVVDEKIGLPTDQRDDLNWRTQVPVEDGIVDMVVHTRDRVYLFEHKAWGKATADQLYEYTRSFQGGNEEVVSVLTTGARWKYESPSQEDVDDPDLLWTWGDIHRFLDERIDITAKNDRIKDFLALLDSEGLGAQTLPTESDLRALPRYIDTLESLYRLLDVIKDSEKEWAFAYDLLPDSHGQQKPEPKWGRQTRSRSALLHGRIALNIYSEPEPGLRAGFIIDPTNIGTELSREGPDLAVFILLPKRDLGSKYGRVVNDQAYKELCQRIENESTNEWTAHIRKGTEPEVNPHHPIVLQKPLATVLRGTSTIGEQREAIMDEFREGTKLFVKGNEMHRLRNVITEHRSSD
jgi:hypothetical protein